MTLSTDTHHASEDPCDLSARALSTLIHARKLSCRELMAAFLARIDRLNPQFNAIVSLQPPQALLTEASQCDLELARGSSRGWMHGLPIAVKDLSDTAGIRSTSGSPIFAEHLPTQDALMVARLRAAGAIVIGKTNTPEFGLGSQTYNTVFGVTRNAYDTALCAGGSSGGAAVALALRMLPVADGSDMGGSLRNPAAYANIYGFRPSAGRVPKYPAADRFGPQLSTDGAMGRSVADVAALLSVQAGYDARVPLSIDQGGAQFVDQLAEQRTNPRIGWLGDLGGHLPMEDGIVAMCAQACRAFEPFGARLEPVMPAFDLESLWSCWITSRSLMVGGALNAHYADPVRRALLKPEAIWEVENGLRASALDVYRASVTRTAWYDTLSDLFDRFDLLVLPSAQVFAFDADCPWPQTVAGRTMDTYHRWMEVAIYATLAGCPALNVPVGFDHRGRAMGMQLIGRPRDDLSVLQWGLAYEQQCDWVSRRRPSLA